MVNLVRFEHVGTVQELAAKGNILAANAELDRVAGLKADDRRNLPILGQPLGEPVPDARAGSDHGGDKYLPVVVAAIATLALGAVERILINNACQLAGEIPGAAAMAPGVVGPHRVMMGELVLAERNMAWYSELPPESVCWISP